MKTCENCSKNHTRRCEEWKQNRRYPDDGGWCTGWKKKPVDNSHLHPVFQDIVDGLTRLPNPAVSGVDE